MDQMGGLVYFFAELPVDTRTGQLTVQQELYFLTPHSDFHQAIFTVNQPSIAISIVERAFWTRPRTPFLQSQTAKYWHAI